VFGFEDERYQAFMNICTNAIQAIEKNEVGKNDYIKVSYKKSGQQKNKHKKSVHYKFIHLCFHDTGFGMEKDIQAKAFDPMFSTKNLGNRKGTG
jgi:signal transduction histidine kinase